MTELRYCTRCLYPETKPEIRFDAAGLCSACQNYDARQLADWGAREREFDKIVRDGSPGHGKPIVIVPVSGGKDSTFQVVKCLDMGYQVLAVNARTDMLSPLGRENLDNIGRLCDVVEYHPNDTLRRRIMRLALEEVGDWSWPEHVLIHTVPFAAAVQWRIPTIVFGELSQSEYGAGPIGSEAMQRMTRRYVEEFAGLLGMRVSDVENMLGLEPEVLDMYKFPSEESLQIIGIQAVWMGQYFPWDGYENSLIARNNGFKVFDGEVEGSLYDYENLDNYATGARDYLRYVKYGYGRATDIASSHIRRGRLTRMTALELVRQRDGAFPWTYLDKPLEEILEMLGLTINQFLNVCDRFTNKRLFQLMLNEPRPQPLFALR